MKFGFDYHGVIDAQPEVISKLCWRLIQAGHEVHIITGHELTEKFLQKLGQYRIVYTHLFSIADYHKRIGTKVWYDEKNTPWMDKDVWNKSKAEYCAREGIDLHIDDSKEYVRHFKTPFMILIRGSWWEPRTVSKR